MKSYLKFGIGLIFITTGWVGIPMTVSAQNYEFKSSHFQAIGEGLSPVVTLRSRSLTGVSAEENVDEFSLQHNYPNPFNPETTIQYNMPENGSVNIQVFNITGALIRTLVQSDKQAGRHSISWNATNEQGQKVASGVYLVMMTVKTTDQTIIKKQKMTLLK